MQTDSHHRWVATLETSYTTQDISTTWSTPNHHSVMK